MNLCGDKRTGLDGLRWSDFARCMFIATITLSVIVLAKDSENNATPNGFTDKKAFDLFSDSEVHHIKSDTYKFLDYPVEHLWETVPEVSENYPFVFFDQRHTGGMSIRQSLKNAISKLKLTGNIACLTFGCNNFGVATDRPKAIYAEYMQWGEQNNFNRFRGEHHRAKFSCMTIFRQPIARLLTCLYAEFEEDFKEQKAVCISDLDDKVLTRIVAEAVDDFGNSCLNEPFRILSGMRDEGELDTVGVVYNDESMSVVNHLKPLDTDVLEMTLSHLEKCVPVVMEMPESFEILKNKFPKLYNNGAFQLSTDPAKVEYSDLKLPDAANKCGPPTKSQMQILEKFTAVEKILYDTVVELVNKAIAGLNIQ